MNDATSPPSTASAPSSVGERHLRLSHFHATLAGVFVVLCAIFLATSWSDLTPSGRVGVPVTFAIPSLVHVALAWGTKVQSELARKVSVGIGVLMLLAFPIGTVLAFFFLPLTQWRTNDAASRQGIQPVSTSGREA